METFLFLFEMLGTIAFAASGAVLGVRKGLDVFGVCILGLTTACGGGMVRDVLLGNTPPGGVSESDGLRSGGSYLADHVSLRRAAPADGQPAAV